MTDKRYSFGRLSAAFLSASVACSAFCAASGEIFPAAEWRSRRSAEIVPPADMKFPGTVAVRRNGPEPMVVTIAGTAEKPIPYGTGNITLGLNYVDGNYSWGYRTALDSFS
jgi:hypothetical protein